MTLIIIGSLALGILCGYFLPLPDSLVFLPNVTDLALALLLFTVGYDLAQEENLREKVRGLPKLALTVPFLIAVGSVIAPMLISPLLKLSPGEGALVGAGFGWYSLSAVIIGQTYDVTLGAIALLANVFREVLAILLIPLIAAKFGHLAAVAPGGATAMDVTLPIVAKATDRETTLIAFYSGTVLTGLVPFLVPFLIKLIQLLN